MTSIATSSAPASSAPAPVETGPAAASDAAKTKDSAGFMTLIDALLQGSTLPGEDATGTQSLPFGMDSTETGSDDTSDDEPSADLLASLGLASLLPGQAQPLPPPSAAQSAGQRAVLTDASAVKAAVAGVSGESGALPSTTDADGQATPGADALLAALSDERAGDASATSSKQPDGLQGLNAWAAAAHRVAGAQDAAPGGGTTPEAALRENVGSQRWREELGARVTLMATQGHQSGSLRLSPEHLGPLEIQITVNDDKTTSVQFGAQHAETRSALQDALPRLRELFASAGLQLGDAGVSGQAPRQRPADDGGFQGAGYDGRSDGEPTLLQRHVRSVTHSGLLDTYA